MDLLHQAIRLHQAGNLDQACALYQQILASEPRHFESLHMLGVIALQRQQPHEALVLLQQALELNTQDVALYIHLGTTLHQLQQYETALACYETAQTLSPRTAAIYFNKGNLHYELAQFDLAAASYEHALALDANYTAAKSNWGLCLQAQNQQEKALEQFDQVCQQTPRDANAHYNRGNALKALHRYLQAIESYNQALTLNPTFLSARYNRATTWQEMLALDSAMADYEQVILQNPNDAKAHWNLSICLLLQGQLKRAWPLYEWRWQVDSLQLKQHPDVQRRWQGQSLTGKRLLITAEQGFGDTLQFCRFAPHLAQQADQVILQVQPALHTLLKQLPQVTVIDEDETLPEFDWHCPLLSLGQAMGDAFETYLPITQAYLQADAIKRAHWQRRLGSLQRPRIGLVWQGNPTHANDAHRSLPLDVLLEKLPKDRDYFALQKSISKQEAQMLDTFNIRHFENDLHDFSDTAALATCMNQVISVDTSVAHLCGALGVKTTVLLPYVADWRWRTTGEATAWYPSLTLLRQDASRQWDNILEHLGKGLTASNPQ